MSSNTSFNPISQNVTFLMANGVQSGNFTFADLDSFVVYNYRLCINYGVQLGACLIMLVITAILTNKSNRRKPVFFLNILSLFFGFLRALFLAIYSVSPWTELWSQQANDFSHVPQSSYRISIAGIVMPFFLTLVVDASLVLQANAVAKVLKRKYYYTIAALSVLVYLLALGFRLAELVTNSLAVSSDRSYFFDAWITTGALATEAIAIWYFSIVFTGKLGMTIYTRRQLGFQRWSYMQILAAMGGCTMSIPSIFAILEYAIPSYFPEAGTLTMTTVALLLPLSSLWASMVTPERENSFNLSTLWASRQSRENLVGHSGSQYTGPAPSRYLPGRQGTIATISPSTNRAIAETTRTKASRDSTEIDLEMMGIQVNQCYSVHSDKVSDY